jgi:hypothetical protein
MLPIGLLIVYTAAIVATIIGLMVTRLAGSLKILTEPLVPLPSKRRERRRAGFECLGALAVIIITAIIFADGINTTIAPELERMRKLHESSISRNR